MPYLHGRGLLTSGPLTATETAEHQVRLSFGFAPLALAKPTGHNSNQKQCEGFHVTRQEAQTASIILHRHHHVWLTTSFFNRA